MSNLVTRGIVLREVNYKEADKILTLLTPEGKLAAKARGVRRKGSRLAAGCQLLVYSELTLFEYKDYYTVNEASSLEQFWGVKRDVELLALGSYFAEVCEAVAEEGVPQPELLSLILNSLYALDKLGKPQALVKAAFELKTACLAGYEPLLDACAVCGAEPDQPAFHIREGVLHCAACRDEVGEGISMPLTPLAVPPCAMWPTGTLSGCFPLPWTRPPRTAWPTPARPFWPPSWSGAFILWTSTSR